MPIENITGTMLQKMLRGAVTVLENNKDEVNALNVFPVPDGDTGTNMFLTLSAALKEAEKESGPLSQVATAASTGSLMGARGNSGVILSQLFRGVAIAWANHGVAGPKDLAQALVEATKTAYRGVMKPVEGTMLTVARITSKEALSAARRGADMETVFMSALAGAQTALAQTPEMLPVLKEAGVVDAGGQGLVYILEGMLAALTGQEPMGTKVSFKLPAASEEHAHASDSIAFGYCTEALVRGKNLSDKVIKQKLSPLGDSMLVVGDRNVIKVHIHTNRPDRVLKELLVFGSLHDIDIDNMRDQETQFQQGPAEDNKKTKSLGVVAVALGTGIKAIFEGLGVDVVVTGGQTMNPSTEELLEAINSVPAESVLVLPNNKNVVLAAKQAQKLANQKVEVVPTRSIAQGIGAMVAFSPDLDIEDNAETMIAAGQKVITGEVTYAVRSTRVDGREIEAGDIMGLVDGKLETVGKEVAQVTLEILRQMVQPESDLITIFSGEETPREDAESLLAVVEEQFPECDVELHTGGQPLYYYLLAVE